MYTVLIFQIVHFVITQIQTTNRMTSTKTNGIYWKDEVPYISVTTVLGIISKPDLLPWVAVETYKAMKEKPDMDVKEAMKAYENARDKAANRGSLVHSMIEVYKSNQTVIDADIPGMDYYSSFVKFMVEQKPEFIYQEKIVFNTVDGYAGKFDLLARINGEVTLTDFKTNKDGKLYPEIQLQLSAYADTVNQTDTNVSVSRIMGVALSPTGYNHQYFERDSVSFGHALELYKWKNKKMLTDIGYFQHWGR